MKNILRTLLVSLVAAPLLFSCADIPGIESKIEALDSRVEALEQLAAQMNTNISALQIAVTALQNRDFVTSVTEIKEADKIIGYTINFSKSGSATIYNGKTPNIIAKQYADGKYYWSLNGQWLTGSDGEMMKVEGENGITPLLKIENGFWMLSIDNGETWTNIGKATGADGATPVIGIKKFTDGVYYWTVNGEFMTDDAGNKIKAQGNDGVTPQLKIENGFWMLSTDNGETWTNMGTAVGGDGDSFFQKLRKTIIMSYS